MTKRTWILALVASLALVARAVPARAACGDGVVDPAEQCDDGAMNGHDACCSAGCTLVDSDGDGTCDAIDPCPQGQGTVVKESKLSIARLRTAPGDDTLRFTGVVDVPDRQPMDPPIDPSTTGVRLRMVAVDNDGIGTAVLDASLPGGARWTGRPNKWTYRDPRGEIAGIRRVALKLGSPIVPTTRLVRVTFVVAGSRGSYVVTPDMVSSAIVQGMPQGNALQVVFALGADGSTAGQCGEVWYTTLRNTNCTFATSGDRVTCTGPPPVGPCHVGDPQDLVFCELVTLASAEARYFAAHATYFSGTCADLPGFVPSPGVVCTVAATSLSFVATAAHPSAYAVCDWRSNPPPNGTNLVCS